MASAEELLMFRRLHPPPRTLSSNPPPPIPSSNPPPPIPSSNPVLIPNDLPPPPPRTPSSNRPSPPPPPPAPSSNPALIANDLIREILKFLPVKSLMRFKCVSKDWLSIITDPSFTSSYAGGFRGPVLFRPRRSEDPFKIIHYLRIHDTGSTCSCEASHHSTVDHGGQTLAHTAVVNGLICFFDARGNTSWLYNIATRERVQLPVSSSPVPPPEGVARWFGCGCHLGFDPVSKLYKLVKLSTIYDKDTDGGRFILRPATRDFEILTIGVDSCWRTIDSPPPYPFGYRGLCVDGVLYGLQLIFTNKCFLTAFHIADERFLSIPLPPDFENRPLNFDDDDWRFGCLQLPMFFPGPGPVLTSFGDSFGATLHIDRYSYGGGGDSGGGEEEGREPEGRWDTDILTLPGGHLRPRGILPNGKVLLADYRAPEPARLSLYDPIKREFENLAVVNWTGPGNKFTGPGDFCFVEENIVSLKGLTSCCH